MKRKNMVSILGVLACTVLAFGLTACKDGNSGGGEDKSEYKIDAPEKYDLKVGDTSFDFLQGVSGKKDGVAATVTVDASAVNFSAAGVYEVKYTLGDVTKTVSAYVYGTPKLVNESGAEISNLPDVTLSYTQAITNDFEQGIKVIDSFGKELTVSSETVIVDDYGIVEYDTPIVAEFSAMDIVGNELKFTRNVIVDSDSRPDYTQELDVIKRKGGFVVKAFDASFTLNAGERLLFVLQKNGDTYTDITANAIVRGNNEKIVLNSEYFVADKDDLDYELYIVTTNGWANITFELENKDTANLTFEENPYATFTVKTADDEPLENGGEVNIGETLTVEVLTNHGYASVDLNVGDDLGDIATTKKTYDKYELSVIEYTFVMPARNVAVEVETAWLGDPFAILAKLYPNQITTTDHADKEDVYELAPISDFRFIEFSMGYTNYLKDNYDGLAFALYNDVTESGEQYDGSLTQPVVFDANNRYMHAWEAPGSTWLNGGYKEAGVWHGVYIDFSKLVWKEDVALGVYLVNLTSYISNVDLVEKGRPLASFSGIRYIGDFEGEKSVYQLKINEYADSAKLVQSINEGGYVGLRFKQYRPKFSDATPTAGACYICAEGGALELWGGVGTFRVTQNSVWEEVTVMFGTANFSTLQTAGFIRIGNSGETDIYFADMEYITAEEYAQEINVLSKLTSNNYVGEFEGKTDVYKFNAGGLTALSLDVFKTMKKYYQSVTFKFYCTGVERVTFYTDGGGEFGWNSNASFGTTDDNTGTWVEVTINLDASAITLSDATTYFYILVSNNGGANMYVAEATLNVRA